MASPERKKGESFSSFKMRRKNEEFDTKEKLKGRLVWNSMRKGTYFRARDGAL